MEETKQLQELLLRLEQSSQKREWYAKLQCLFSIVTAFVFAAMLIIVLCYIPKLNGIIDQADTILYHAEQVSRQLAEADIEGVMTDLKDVTEQMAQTDLSGIARDVGSLVQTTQASVEDAMSKLNSMDLETLNQAISDLASVMKPLSNFFGKLR